MVRDSLAAGMVQADAACSADIGAASLVFVIRGDVADAGMQADGVGETGSYSQ